MWEDGWLNEALRVCCRLRRRTQFWTDEEEECLRRGVQKFGAGKWKLILEDGCGVFSSHRTNIDLKVGSRLEVRDRGVGD